jgi:hypothetical protein
MGFQPRLLSLAVALFGVITPSAAGGEPPCGGANPPLLVTGLAGASGSTIGLGGALYVTEPAAGRISRVNPKTGHIKTFASGLPEQLFVPGGAMVREARR